MKTAACCSSEVDERGLWRMDGEVMGLVGSVFSLRGHEHYLK